MKRAFAWDSGMRSTAMRYDPCIIGNDKGRCKILCDDCKVFLISDRFLGEEFHREILGRTFKRSEYMYPYVLIADAVGCNLDCWFCYAHNFLKLSKAKEKCQVSFISPTKLAEQFGCKFRKVSSVESLEESINSKKTFLGPKERNKAIKHVRMKLPFMRIRISGGEPIYADKEVLDIEKEEGPLRKENVKYWLMFFEAFDRIVGDLKADRIIHLTNKKDWREGLPYPTFLSEREGRLSIRFDTNGIWFGNKELTDMFVNGIFDLHKSGRLNHILIQIDYSIKGSTPMEYWWSQSKELPVSPQKNNILFRPEEHPQYTGYKNINDVMNKCFEQDVEFRDCFDMFVEKGIDHNSNEKVYVNYPESLNWENFTKVTDIDFSQVVNCFDLNLGWHPEAKLYRYANRGGMIQFRTGQKSVNTKENSVNEILNFWRTYKNASDFEIQAYPIGQTIKVERAKAGAFQLKIAVKRESVAGWVLSGNPQNWDVALREGKWGVKTGLEELWNLIGTGDILVFYATRPISGVIGYGKVRETIKENHPLWPDEIMEARVKYPLRIGFDSLFHLPRDKWASKRLSIRFFGLEYFRGLNMITNKDSLKQLLENFKKV